MTEVKAHGGISLKVILNFAIHHAYTEDMHTNSCSLLHYGVNTLNLESCIQMKQYILICIRLLVQTTID